MSTFLPLATYYHAFCIFLYCKPLVKKKKKKPLKRQWPSTEPHAVTPQTMHYSDTGTLIMPLWGQLFDSLQILLILLSTHPPIFVWATNISRKDSDKSIAGIKIGGS